MMGVLALSVALLLTVGAHRGFDARVYHGALLHWIHGGELYDWGLGDRHLGFTYPPVAALLLSPLALLPEHSVVFVLAAASIAIVLLAAVRLLRGTPRKYLTLALLAVTLLVTTPMRDTLGFGQVNLLLCGLVIADVSAYQRGSRWAGAATGAAAAFKLTPAAFLVLALLRADTRRMAVRGLASAGLLTLAATVAAPGASRAFWFHTLWDTDRVGHVESATNQSLFGLTERVLGVNRTGEAVGLLLSLVAAALILPTASRLWERGLQLEATITIGVLITLVAPISWMHHLVWDPFAAAVLLIAAVARRAWPAVLGWSLVLVMLMPALPDIGRQPDGEHLDHGLLAVGLENAFVAIGVLLLLGMRGLATGDEPTPDGGAGAQDDGHVMTAIAGIE